MSGATASIFFRNLTAIVRARADVVYLSWEHSSPMFSIPGVANSVRAQLRNVLHKVHRMGVHIVLRLRLSASKTPAVFECFENASYWSGKAVEEVLCPCLNTSLKVFDKVKGHTFTLLSDYLERTVGCLPDGWSVKSRLPPSLLEHQGLASVKFNEFKQKLVNKTKGVLSEEQVTTLPCECFNNGRVAGKWCAFTKGKDYPSLQQRMLAVKNDLKRFCVTSIDKAKEAAIILCPLKYVECLSAFSKNLQPLSVEEYSSLLGRFFKRGTEIGELVFCHFRSAARHKFGLVRLWLKAKSIYSWPEDWESLLWRPLVSYARHWYAKLLSFLGGFCNWVASNGKNLEGGPLDGSGCLGFHVGDPATVLQRVAEFNAKRLKYQRTHGPQRVKIDLYDVKEFFTHISRHLTMCVLQHWVDKVLELHPETPFLCIPKRPRTVYLPFSNTKHSLRKKLTKDTRTPFLAKAVSRHEYGMHVSKFPQVLQLDFDFDVVLINKVPHRILIGMNMGSPAAACAPSLAAAHIEEVRLSETSVELRTAFEEQVLALRWQDDLKLSSYGLDQVEGLEEFVESFTLERSYGDELSLQAQEGIEGFGFLWFDDGHMIRVMAKHRFDRTRVNQPFFSQTVFKFLNSGKTFVKVTSVVAELKGQVLRILDTSNMSRYHVLCILVRLVAEWVKQDVELSARLTALRCFKDNCTFELGDGFLSVASMPRAEALKICSSFDAQLHNVICKQVARQTEIRSVTPEASGGSARL